MVSRLVVQPISRWWCQGARVRFRGVRWGRAGPCCLRAGSGGGKAIHSSRLPSTTFLLADGEDRGKGALAEAYAVSGRDVFAAARRHLEEEIAWLDGEGSGGLEHAVLERRTPAIAASRPRHRGHKSRETDANPASRTRKSTDETTTEGFCPPQRISNQSRTWSSLRTCPGMRDPACTCFEPPPGIRAAVHASSSCPRPPDSRPAR